MMSIEIPNVTQQLLEIITLGERFAEETTSIPLITQGQSGATTPETYGAAQLQNSNANQLLRSIGYAFDDYITEPVVRQYYEWLLLDPDVPIYEKGEFQIDAHGSIALVERAIQDQTIAQMGAMAANQIYGIDPKKWAELFIKSKRLSPDQLMYSEEEQQRMEAAPPPEQPAVTVAKINADTQLKLGVMKQTADQQTVQHEGQIAAAAHVLEVNTVQVDQQKAHLDAVLRAPSWRAARDRADGLRQPPEDFSLDAGQGPAGEDGDAAADGTRSQRGRTTPTRCASTARRSQGHQPPAAGSGARPGCQRPVVQPVQWLSHRPASLSWKPCWPTARCPPRSPCRCLTIYCVRCRGADAAR
jgi:hypothetical protein